MRSKLPLIVFVLAVFFGLYTVANLRPAEAYHAAEFAEPIAAPTSSLKISGDVKTVEVPRTVVILDKVQVVDLTTKPLTITAPAGATDYRWKYPVGVTATDDDSETLEITSAPKGLIVVSVRMKTYSVVDGKIVVAAKTGSITVTIGEVIPPEPPKPVVPVGFRVLLVHESQEAAPVFFDARSIKLYLDAKTVKDGTQPSWRRIDKDNPGANLPKDLRLMWEAARPKVSTYPAVVIAVNGDVTIHELPKDEAALIQLLKKHGGE